MKYDKRYITKIVSALVMGDGTLISIKGKGNSKLVITQSNPHKDFIDLIESKLESVTKIHTHVRVMEKITHNDQNILATRRHPLYTQMRKRFYIEGKKVVDPHAMKLLDGEFLAYWYMCDGTYFYSSSNHSHVLNLCTEAFSYGDHLMLQKYLYENLNLNFRIHKRKDSHRLYLPVKEYKKFTTIVKPYIVESFEYKLPTIESCTLSPSSEGDEIVRT